MICKRYILALVFVLLCIQHVVSQSVLSKEAIKNFSSEDINQLNFETYTIEDFSNSFDVAVALINEETHSEHHIKGTNVLGALAKALHYKVKHKLFDLDAPETELLLKKFETQSYFISRPTPGQFLKLMKYSCQGDYSHIYDRFSKSSFFVPLISAFVVYIVLFLFCLYKKTKIGSRFIKWTIYGIVFFCVVTIVFKLTCDYNIKDYSFYGITM